MLEKKINKPEYLICVDGIPCPEKTKAIQYLSALVKEGGRESVIINEFDGTETTREAYEILKKDKIDPLARLFLFVTIRIETIRKAIKPALEQGKFVFYDYIGSLVDTAYASHSGLWVHDVRKLDELVTDEIEELEKRLGCGVRHLNCQDPDEFCRKEGYAAISIKNLLNG